MANRDQLYNDPEETFRISFEGFQSGMWTAMPGIVKAVDFSEMTLSVQPAIQGTIVGEDGVSQQVKLPMLIHVPINFQMAGGFALTLPIAINDEVLVVWACRAIDSWWQSGGVQKAVEVRMHDLSDGFAIIGIKSKPNVIPNISTTGAQLRNQDGTTYLEIASDGKIKMVAPPGFEVTGPTKVTGDVTVTGNISASLDVTAKSTTVPVHLSLHTHTGVTSGGSNTGGPVG